MGQRGAQNGKVMMGGDFSHRQAPGEVTPHIKTDSITDFSSLLVCFVCVFVCVCFYSLSSLSGSASMLKWFGATTVLLISSYISNVVASTRQELESKRLEVRQVRTWTHPFYWKLMFLFFFLWHFASCYYSIIRANIPLDYKRHCEKKGLMISSKPNIPHRWSRLILIVL